MNAFSRREALATMSFSAATLALADAKAAPVASPIPPALAGKHEVAPLPFKAGSLHGLSERLITSHHDNNYASAVKNLNRVEQELSRANKDTPPFLVAALREKELTFRNSKSLHERYFANLGGDGKRSGPIEAALAEAYGSSAAWEEQFRATGAGLGGGSGWVVLALELDGGALRTVGAGNHTQALAMSIPLFVMDMYEHAYQMDFGAAAAKYIDAFFANSNWSEVNRRLDHALAAVAWLGKSK
ncbi:MAG: superoxide dismutase [Myxococcales bacterium]|jgi:Fe-Mn family superoxide dismutase|nr:superoxide dismutase [Myxococcales bacterium]